MNDLRQALETSIWLSRDHGVETAREMSRDLGIIKEAARRVLGFPSPEAVEGLAEWIFNDRRRILGRTDLTWEHAGRLKNGIRDEARAALMAAATTDFGKETE